MGRKKEGGERRGTSTLFFPPEANRSLSSAKYNSELGYREVVKIVGGDRNKCIS